MDISDLKKKLKNNKLAKLLMLLFLPNPYNSFYSKLGVDKNVVLYESFYGKGMSCGPRAIFEAIRKLYPGMRHVWVYDRKENWQDNFKDFPEVEFVRIKSRKYYRYLASAGYLVNNSTFPYCFTKKDGQVYINTWHGIPLKSMGYEMPNGNIEVANTERNYLQADYLLSPNPHHTSMYMDSYKLDNAFSGKILECGQARCDTLLKSDKKQVRKRLERLGLNIKDKKQIILYAPTWKGKSFSSPDVAEEEFLALKHTIEKKCDSNRYQVIFKPHQAVYETFVRRASECLDITVPPSFDTNELLAGVDILITDYSSIFFDFMVTKRPVLFFIPDLAEYQEDRGLYYSVDELPGPCTEDVNDLADYINNIDNTAVSFREQYERVYHEMCPREDGCVSQRVVRAVFENIYDNMRIIEPAAPKGRYDRKKIFIALGRPLQNGITHSFMNLLDNLDYDKYDVTAYLYEPQMEDQIIRTNEINKNVRVLVRCSHLFATRWEMIRMGIALIFNLKGIFGKIFPERYLERQAKRLAGNTEFDAIVEFCGYSPILALMLPKMKAKRKSIWMHNDMIADANRKIGHKKPLKKKMDMVFSTYDRWDRMVSCSSALMEVNEKNLLSEHTKGKFRYARNTLNYKRVLDCLNEKCRYEGFPMPEDKDINFVTMGRLSTEKNHRALIQAFAEFHSENSGSRLYILGEGPLRNQLEDEIEALELKDSVILTGNLINPFVLMSKCSCFILPSLYEGMPMVILEARVVGLPIIVSDFSSVKDSLIENGQYLIKSDKASIIKGLNAFKEGNVPGYSFDPESYNKKAILEFEKAVF